MSRIINLTEKDIRMIVQGVLNEGTKEYLNKPKPGCETYKKGCDPYRYLKVVDGSKTKYFFKKEQDQKWIEAKNISGVTSIQNVIKFNSTPEITSKLNNQPKQEIVKGNKMKIDNNKIINGNYSPEELKSIVNNWNPTYDFNLQGSNDNERKSYDWKTNVDKTTNAVYNWRNKLMDKIRLNPNLSKNKKRDAEEDILLLSTLVSDKLEKEYQKRWKGIA